MNNNNSITVSAYCDSDHAGNRRPPMIDKGHSTSGFRIKINDCPVHWMSKKQKTVAQSSCESELLALAACTKEVIWMRNLLEELIANGKSNSNDNINNNINNKQLILPTSFIYCDNSTAVNIIKNDQTSTKTKHAAKEYYLVHDHVEKNDIKVEWISGEEQQADILTKIISKPAYIKFKSILMDTSINSNQ